MELRILDALPGHLDTLEAIERECFSSPWTRLQLMSAFPDGQHEFLVVEDADGQVLGYVGMLVVLDEGYISNVAVRSAHRRMGVGDALIRELLRRSEERDLAFVTLEVRESNAAARSLYAKHGFVDVGRRKHYYVLPTEDAILMTKVLK